MRRGAHEPQPQWSSRSEDGWHRAQRPACMRDGMRQRVAHATARWAEPEVPTVCAGERGAKQNCTKELKYVEDSGQKPI